MLPILDRTISAFIKKHWDGQSPLLLAFSGGPDSLALLHLLLDYFEDAGLDAHRYLALAHVDHGWRAESSAERRQIEHMAVELRLSLHTRILEPEQCTGNLEDACRQRRLSFFNDLCTGYGYQAVFLAQHADDQAETVLKRVLEGAALVNMGSMQPVALFEGMLLWRPLLQVKKRQLVDFLTARGLAGFDDITNSDPKFLRGKLRTRILPALAKAFGKEVVGSLLNLSFEAAELRSYLEAKTLPFLEQIHRGSLGLWLDLSAMEALLPLEIKFLVRKSCELEKIILSRANIAKAAELLVDKLANKSLSAGDRSVYFDRGHLFIFSDEQRSLPVEKLLLRPGMYRFGRWSVRVTFQDKIDGPISSWRDLWTNEAAALLPAGDYYLAAPEKSAALARWWSNEKVPAILRECVPVIYNDREIAHEFLSGRQMSDFSGIEGPGLKVELFS